MTEQGAIARRRGRRVLVVEDHPDSRELVLVVARRCARDCVGVATAQDARREFLENRPDVVITDYELPDGNGLELLAWIRENQDEHELTVMLVSAHRDRLRLRRAATACGAMFFPKPLDLRALHEAIAEALDRS